MRTCCANIVFCLRDAFAIGHYDHWARIILLNGTIGQRNTSAVPYFQCVQVCCSVVLTMTFNNRAITGDEFAEISCGSKYSTKQATKLIETLFSLFALAKYVQHPPELRWLRLTQDVAYILRI